jgi:PAS domain S-box-containing protein
MLLVFVCLGLIGNFLHLPIFFNVDFIFGSIFALLIFQLYGFIFGVLSAAVISSVTFLLWSHPYAIVIATCEVAVVGLLIKRGNISLLIADILYWLFIGMPLVYLFFHHAMSIPMDGTLVIMLKQSLNGIINTVFSRILFLAISYRLYREKTTLREAIFNGVALFALLAALLTIVIDSRADYSRMEEEMRQTLIRRSDRAAVLITQWLDRQFVPIVTLAKQAASLPADKMQPLLEETHATQSDFLRIGLVDSDGYITAYSPRYDELGQPNIKGNFIDRPYIPILRQTLKPMLSEVVMGRLGKHKPFVAVLAPIMRNDQYGGYIIGVLDFDKMQSFISVAAGGGEVFYSVLDRHGKVIVTNRNDIKAMDPFSFTAGTLKPIDDKLSQLIAPIPGQSSAMLRWNSSSYVIQTSIGSQSEWTIILEQPLATYQKMLFDTYARRLIVVFCLLAGFFTVTTFFSNKISRSLEELRSVSTNLPDKLSTGDSIQQKESFIFEIDRLYENFIAMANVLRQKFQEIQSAHELLESKVAERTAQLSEEMLQRAEAEERFQKLARERETILNTVKIGICLVRNGILQWSNAWHDQIFGCETGESIGVSPQTWFISIDDYAQLRHAHNEQPTGRSFVTIDTQLRRKNGEYFWANLVISAIDGDDPSRGEIWAIRDISAKRHAEEALRKLSRAVEQSPVSVVITDLEAKIEYVNPMFTHITGYSADEVIGQNPRILKSEHTPAENYQALWNALQKGREWRGEFCNRRKDGSLYWEFASISPICNAAGVITHYLGIKEDITDRKLSEMRLMESLREKESLLKEIHHRVKNNMQVISSLLDLQSQRIRDEQLRDVFQESRLRIKAMSLVHEKLYQTERLSRIDMCAYITDLMREIASVWKIPPSSLRITSVAASLDIERAVPLALILNELITNACKYAFTAEDRGIISLDFSQKESDYVLTVRDNGRGLPSEFDASKAETLGYQLVHILTKQLHGTVTVNSSQGTIVTVTFPVSQQGETHG